MNLSFLKGKTAIVTGASGGIGGAICEKLAENGINLTIVGRNAEKLKKVKAAVEYAGCEVLPSCYFIS